MFLLWVNTNVTVTTVGNIFSLIRFCLISSKVSIIYVNHGNIKALQCHLSELNQLNQNSDTSIVSSYSTNVTFTTDKAINQSLLCRNM